MNDKQLRIAYILQITITVMIAGILSLPIIFYSSTFGNLISDNHTRWGEMGSAMSGIYSPIFSLLALFVLIGQARLQKQINIHQFDQAYIQEARADVQYYLEQLDVELDKLLESGVSVREFLHSAFEYADTSSMYSMELVDIARKFDCIHPRVCAIWSAIYPLLEGLRSQKRFPYEHNFTSAKQKTIVMTSFRTCVALDNYLWCISEGKLLFNYEFSPTILPKNGKG